MANNKNELKTKLWLESNVSMVATELGEDREFAKRTLKRAERLLYMKPKVADKAAKHFPAFMATIMRFAPLDLNFYDDIQVNPTKEGSLSHFVAQYTSDGLRKLFHRSPRIKTQAPVVVHEHDEFMHRKIIGEEGRLVDELSYEPSLDDPGPPRLGFMSYAVDGEWDILLVRKPEFQIAENASKHKKIWELNPVPMWKKTMILRLARCVPLYDAIGTQRIVADDDMQDEIDHMRGDSADQIGDVADAWSGSPASDADGKKPAPKKRGRPKKDAPKAEGKGEATPPEAAASSGTPPPEASGPPMPQDDEVDNLLNQQFGAQE